MAINYLQMNYNFNSQFPFPWSSRNPYMQNVFTGVSNSQGVQPSINASVTQTPFSFTQSPGQHAPGFNCSGLIGQGVRFPTGIYPFGSFPGSNSFPGNWSFSYNGIQSVPDPQTQVPVAQAETPVQQVQTVPLAQADTEFPFVKGLTNMFISFILVFRMTRLLFSLFWPIPYISDRNLIIFVKI